MSLWKYTPIYPRLAYAEGPKCGHRQNRNGGRIPLDCVRPPHGKEVNHLHDVPPEYLLPDTRDVGHGPCPCEWCKLMRRKPDATPLERYEALARSLTMRA